MCLAYCPPSFLKYIVSRSTLDLIPELCIPHSAFIPHSFPPVAPLLRHCRRTFGVIIASGGYGTRTPVPVRRKEPAVNARCDDERCKHDAQKAEKNFRASFHLILSFEDFYIFCARRALKS